MMFDDLIVLVLLLVFVGVIVSIRLKASSASRESGDTKEREASGPARKGARPRRPSETQASVSVV